MTEYMGKEKCQMENVYTELTLLYLKKQDIKDLSPAELYDKYREVFDEICAEAKNYKPKTDIHK